MYRTRRSSIVRLAGVLLIGSVIVMACGSSSPGVAVKNADENTTETQPTDTTAPKDETTEPSFTDTTGDPPVTEATDTTEPTTDESTSTTAGGVTDMTLPGTEIPLDGPFPFDANKPPQVFDGLTVATINDIIAWWTEQMPQVFGIEYAPLKLGVFPAYPGLTTYPPKGCVETYEDIENNGEYCSAGDYVTWDDPGYLKTNYEDHGSGAVTGLFSHEWGHVIQERAGDFDRGLPTIITELQADCYSGAWFAHVARGESSLLQFTDADIRSGVIDTVMSADPVGITADTPGAHGAGFDRVGAFQDGFDKGPANCALYSTTAPPPVTEFGFTDDQTQANDTGNLSFDDFVKLEPQDLNAFWQANQADFPTLSIVPFTADSPPSCSGASMEAQTNPIALYCSADNNVYLDQAAATDVLDRYGDGTLGYIVESAWAEAAQTAAGGGLVGESRVLYGDCLVGVYEGDLLAALTDTTRDRGIVSISPGDLDEAISAAILLADDNASDDVRGDTFAKTDAFRFGALASINSGVAGGFTTCGDSYAS